MRVFDTRSRLMNVLGDDSGLLISHYTNAANTRIAEKQKWLADIEWLKFQNIEDELRRIDNQYETQKRTLDEDLTDQLRGIK